jgi:hypothetical protein
MLRGVLVLCVCSTAIAAGVFQCHTDAGGQCLFEVDAGGHATSRVSGGGNCTCEDLLRLNDLGEPELPCVRAAQRASICCG